MRKTLIAAIIVVAILLAAAIGIIVYMESAPSEQGDETTVPETSTVQPSEEAETEEPVETTEETVGISLPTENPDEVTPEVTFGEEDIVPPVTGDIPTGETEDPDANETPEDIF